MENQNQNQEQQEQENKNLFLDPLALGKIDGEMSFLMALMDMLPEFKDKYHSFVKLEEPQLYEVHYDGKPIFQIKAPSDEAMTWMLEYLVDPSYRRGLGDLLSRIVEEAEKRMKK